MYLQFSQGENLVKKHGYVKTFNECVDLIAVRKLIQKTIEVSYPGCYDDEVVDYFKEYNQADKILYRANKGFTLVYKYDNKVVGAGSLVKSNIDALFVDPLYQFNGIGKKIVNALLCEAFNRKLQKLMVNATPLAMPFFAKLGFSVVSERVRMVNNSYPLTFYRMQKLLYPPTDCK